MAAPGVDRRRTHGARRPPGALPARILPAAGRPEGADHLPGRPDPRRPLVHHPAGAWRSSTASRSSRCRRRSRSTSRASTTPCRCRGVPDPEACRPRRADRPAPRPPSAVWAQLPRPFDIRYVTSRRGGARSPGPTDAHNQVWFRADGVVPDDPLLHVCLMAYLSDLTLLDSVLIDPRPGAGLDETADGLARPRDVVPPADPDRRLGALRHRVAAARPAPGGWRPGTSSPPTGGCCPPWSRRD